MSRTILVALAGFIAVAASAALSPAPADAGGTPGSGDADCSGAVDSEDALAIMQLAARLRTSDGLCLAAANVYPDPRTDVVDALLILQFHAGRLDNLPHVPQPVLDAVLAVAAEELDAPPESLSVTAKETGTWPDGCLGLGRPDEPCAAVITHGWRLTIEADGRGGVWRVGAGIAANTIRLEALL